MPAPLFSNPLNDFNYSQLSEKAALADKEPQLQIATKSQKMLTTADTQS